MKWHDLTSVRDDFFTTAAVCTTVEIEVPVPPESLWDALAADDAVVSWSPLVTAASWAGDRGVGAIRTVTIAKVLSVRENFYRWDINSRMTFAAEATTGPGIRAFAEDYVISGTPQGSALSWTVAADVPGGSALGGVGGAALRPAVGSMATGLRRKLLQENTP